MFLSHQIQSVTTSCSSISQIPLKPLSAISKDTAWVQATITTHLDPCKALFITLVLAPKLNLPSRVVLLKHEAKTLSDPAFPAE